MNTLKYANSQHTKLDIIVALVAIVAIGFIDITGLPEPVAVLGYQILLLTVMAAIIHIFYARHLKNHSD